MNGDTDRRERKKRGERGGERERERKNKREGQEVPVECVALCNECDRVLCFLLALPLDAHLSACDARAHPCTYAHPRAQCRSRAYRRVCIEYILYRWRFPLSPSRVCGRNAAIERHRHEITIARQKSPRNTRVFI